MHGFSTLRQPATAITLGALLFATASCGQPPAEAPPNRAKPRPPHNGFDVSNATIPFEEIRGGGPRKDGIPAILDPKFIDPSTVDFLQDDDLVMSVTVDETTRAYPHRIIVWHEIVNDTIGARNFAVTYCPLCGTSMVFDRQVGDAVLSFGVSGLLYQSDVLLYDHQSESLWSQLKMEAVSGLRVGDTLDWLDSGLMTWKTWRETYPNGQVLSTDTGFSRRYANDAYRSYKISDAVMFPVPEHRTELGKKEWVIGVHVNGRSKAYPLQLLSEREGEVLTDTIEGRAVEIRYDVEAQWARVTDAATGESIPNTRVYWFAWQAFYPETLLFGE